MSKPKISVVMPVYNGGKYLKDSIESILSQSYPYFEFLIIDDKSTDNSLKIIKEYAQKDKRIIILKNKKNRGVAKSLVKTIKLAKGKYIARQDADDISKPVRFEKQIKFLEQTPSYGAIGTSALIIDKTGKIIKKAKIPYFWFVIKKALQIGNCFIHGSMMFSRDIYLRCGGYNKNFRVGQDLDLWLKISNIKKMKNLKETLYLWRKIKSNRSSLEGDLQFKTAALALYSHRYRVKLKDDFEVNQFIDDLKPKDQNKYYACLGNLYLRHGNIKMSEKYFVNATFREYIINKILKLIIKSMRILK